jgi:hypothetical protein
MNRKLIIFSALGGSLLAGSLVLVVTAEQNTSPAAPATPSEQPLATLVKNSEFAFQGVVTKVEYKSSNNARPIPHTFVTFKVEKFLKGTSKPEFVTLRFLGGADGKGNFLTVSGVPLFDVGDRDILFTKGNGKFACPLVNCEAGRWRSINNQMFTDDGKPLLINSQGLLSEGKPVALKQVLTNKIGDVTLTSVLSQRNRDPKNSDRNSNSTSETPSLKTSVAQSKPLQPEQVESLVKSQLLELSRTRQLVTPQNVTFNANSKAGFVLPEPKPVAPAQIAPPKVRQSLSVPKNDLERRELELLRKNRGNPVFTNSKPSVKP